MEQKNKIGLIALVFALLALNASGTISNIYDSITCTNCTLDNPTFVNFSIPATWGDGSKVNKSGDTITGDLIFSDYVKIKSVLENVYISIAPDAIEMTVLDGEYSTTYVQETGGTVLTILEPGFSTMYSFTPNYLAVDNTRIINLANATNDYDAVNYQQLNTKLNKTGGNITGNLNMNDNVIINPLQITHNYLSSIYFDNYFIKNEVCNLIFQCSTINQTYYKITIESSNTPLDMNNNLILNSPSLLTNSSIQINESQVNNLTTDLNSKVNKSGDNTSGFLGIGTNYMAPLHVKGNLTDAIAGQVISIFESNQTISNGTQKQFKFVARDGGNYGTVLFILGADTLKSSALVWRVGNENSDGAQFSLGTSSIQDENFYIIMRQGTNQNAVKIDTALNMTIFKLAGSGTRAVCTDSTGKFVASTNATSNYLTC